MTTHHQQLNNTFQKCEEYCSTRACGQATLKFMFNPRRQIETSTTLEQHTSEPATRSQLCRRRAGASEMMSATRCSEPFSARNVIGQLVHGRGNMLPTRHANLFGGAMLRSSWTPTSSSAQLHNRKVKGFQRSGLVFLSSVRIFT